MNRRTRLRCALVVAAALALAGCSHSEVQLADGSAADWAQWHGHWIVINYWAGWCAPCRKEIPELNHFHRDTADSGVVVLGVNFDGLQGDDLTSLIKEMGIDFPVLLNDPGKRWKQHPPSVLPSTLVIDPDGHLQQVLVGPQTYQSLTDAVHPDANASS